MMEKIYNFKTRKRIHIFEKNKIIHFVNVEIDPRLLYLTKREKPTSNKNNPDSLCVCKLKEPTTN
jgi:hypothetical protein